MRIAVLNYEDPWLVIVSTSLIRGLQRVYPDCKIVFFLKQETEILLRYNKDIELINGYTIDDMHFDKVINLSPSLEASNLCSNLIADQKYGFIDHNSNVYCINKNAEEYYNSVFCNNRTNKCILQLLFRLANLRWRGEGYKFSYYPKNKTNRANTGVAIQSERLREFLKSNLQLSLSDVKYLSNKNNLLKKIDEINRCKNIITDDLFILHVAISLRKNVQFLDNKGLGYNIEFFGSGNHHRIAKEHSADQTQ